MRIYVSVPHAGFVKLQVEVKIARYRQTEKFQSRTRVSLSFKLKKQWKIVMMPMVSVPHAGFVKLQA